MRRRTRLSGYLKIPCKPWSMFGVKAASSRLSNFTWTVRDFVFFFCLLLWFVESVVVDEVAFCEAEDEVVCCEGGALD